MEGMAQELPEWTVRNNKLHREFNFPNFKTAFRFMSKVAVCAESMNHHPEWSNVYNKVTIDLITHSKNKVTQLDITLAKTIDSINDNIEIIIDKQEP